MAAANQLMRPWIPRQNFGAQQGFQQGGGQQPQQNNVYQNQPMRPESKKINFFQREVHDLRNDTAVPFHEDESCYFLCFAVNHGQLLDEKLRLQRIRPVWTRIGEDLKEGMRRCDWLSDHLTANTNSQIYEHLQRTLQEANDTCGVHPESLRRYLGMPNPLPQQNLAQQFDMTANDNGQDNILQLLQQIARGMAAQPPVQQPPHAVPQQAQQPFDGNMNGYRVGEPRAGDPQVHGPQVHGPQVHEPHVDANAAAAQADWMGPPSGNQRERVRRRVADLELQHPQECAAADAGMRTD